MVTIKQISLVQYRNYPSARFDFTAPISCITGLNGTGKTNLLDAIYYLCYTKSYFSAYQQHIATHGADGFRLDGLFFGDMQDELITCKWKAGKKEIFADSVLYDKQKDHIGKYAAVMIAPDDIALINEGGEVRRRWMDSILGQSDMQYLESLLLYQNVLQQRNAWLKLYATKSGGTNAALDFYDQKLSETGTYIYNKRTEFITGFIGLVTEYYHLLAQGKEVINVSYQSQLAGQSLFSLLQSRVSHDIRLMRTTSGVHRDELEFTLDNKSFRQYGSQGQKKTFLFALKLAQYFFLKNIKETAPILLLDDVFEKLDEKRLEALLVLINNGFFGQVLITDTHHHRAQKLIGTNNSLQSISL